ncbi:MAG: acetylxylan esterase [Sediminibacterium sp.]|nr:acetylxylan esterase [Sediminibacterium sp.]
MATKYSLTILSAWLICILGSPLSSFAFQKGKTADPISVIIEAANKKASFNKKTPVKFKISIKNSLPDDQEGTLEYTVNDENGNEVNTGTLEVKVNAKKKLESSFEVPVDDEGTYTLNVTIALNEFKEIFTRGFSYKGPSRTPKDRKDIPDPYEQNWSRDNLGQTGSSTKEALVVESDEAVASEEEESEEEGEIITVIKPLVKDGVFKDGTKVKYTVTISNKYKTKQEGTFRATITNEDGTKTIGVKEVVLKIPKKGVRKFIITMPSVIDPGVYNISAALNLTTYDDTTYHAFGYRLGEIATPYHRPPDFDQFWKDTRAELDKIDPQYKISFDEGRSTYFHTVYKVEMQSYGNITCFGWLSIPKPKGKYPVLIGFGGYKIELRPLYFDDFISFTVNVRGIDSKVREQINPDNREQLLVNIEDKENYIYRGIYMDCLRAVEFIYSHSDMGMDLGRIVAFGGSQGASLALITAAMMPEKINTVVANNPIFFDWVRHIEISKGQKELNFPIRDMRDFERKNPEVSVDLMVHTLQYFEVQNFMPWIQSSVLYAVSLLDQFVPPGTALASYNKMDPNTIKKSEQYIFPSLGHEVPRSHDAFVSKWFLEKVVSKIKR